MQIHGSSNGMGWLQQNMVAGGNQLLEYGYDHYWFHYMGELWDESAHEET